MTSARVSPVFFFSLALALAILCDISYDPLRAAAACIPAALGLALRVWGARRLRLLALWLLAASLGWTAAWIRCSAGLEHTRFCGVPVTRVTAFRGRLVEDSVGGEGGETLYRLRLNAVNSRDAAAPASGRVLLTVQGGQKLYLGQKLTVRGGLRRLEGGGGNQYLGRAAAHELEKEGFSGGIFRLRSRLRDALSRRTETLSPPAAALTRALLFGEREALSAETVARFRTSGSFHVLALSGLHVGILFLLIRALFSFLPGRNSSFWIGALFTLFYLGLVGLRPSLTRAVLMLIAAGGGRVLDRDSEPLNCLALAAGVILLADPAAVYSLSFQLSFLSLLGILCLGPEISRLLDPHLPPLIGMPLACSLGAQAASAPVLLAAFGVVYPIGILASLLVIPLVTLCVWLGVAFLPAAPVPLAGPAIAFSLARTTALLERVTEIGSRAPGLRIDWRLYCAVLAAVCLLYAAGRRAAGRRARYQGALGYEPRFTG
jgi:competence protein ComEC